MIKLYKQNRQTQLEWMRKNPGKTVAINLAAVAGLFAYYAYQDWKFNKQLKSAREKLEKMQ